MKNYYLDWIRLVAVLGVLYGHLIVVASYAPSIDTVLGSNADLPIIPFTTHKMIFLDVFLTSKFKTASAAVGVVLFFWLAGYLAAMTRERYADGIVFFKSRCSRMLPGLILALAVSIPIAYTQGYSYSCGAIILNLLLLHNIFGYGSIIGSLWTLIVEYYFDIIAIIIPKFTSRRIILAQLIILGLVAFQAFEQNTYLVPLVYGIRFVSMIFFGSMIYNTIVSTGRRFFNLCISGMLSYITIFISIHYTFKFDVFYKSFMTYVVAGFIWLFFYYLDKINIGFIKKTNKIVQYLVDTSYLVFLLQLNVGLTFMYYLKEKVYNPYIIVLGGIALTYIISTFLHYALEKRILNYLKMK